MKKLMLLLALFLPFLSGFNSTEVLAQTTVDRFTHTSTRVVPCTGETVDLEGRFQTTTNVRVDAAGGYHVTDNWSFHAEGIGSYGNEYRVNYTDNYNRNFGAGDLPQTWSWPIISNLISKGDAPNVKIKWMYHRTINKLGEMTAYFDHFELVCK